MDETLWLWEVYLLNWVLFSLIQSNIFFFNINNISFVTFYSKFSKFLVYKCAEKYLQRQYHVYRWYYLIHFSLSTINTGNIKAPVTWLFYMNQKITIANIFNKNNISLELNTKLYCWKQYFIVFLKWSASVQSVILPKINGQFCM